MLSPNHKPQRQARAYYFSDGGSTYELIPFENVRKWNEYSKRIRRKGKQPNKKDFNKFCRLNKIL